MNRSPLIDTRSAFGSDAPRVPLHAHGLGKRVLSLTLGALIIAGGLTRVAAENSEASLRTYAHRSYDVYAGMPHHGVPVVYQTRDGYMWFGTESGLARFDGEQFVTFRTATTPELPANLMRTLFEDKDGWLWIGTQGGVCRYRDGKFERIESVGQRISSITGDSAGRIWISSQNEGLYEYVDGKVVSHANDPGMPAEKDLRTLFVDSRGRLFAIFRSAGIVVLENGKFNPLDTRGHAVGEHWSMTESPNGTLWVVHSTGLVRIREDETKNYASAEFGGEPVRTVYADRHGRIWAITSGIHVLDTTEDRFVRVPVPSVENARAILEDREGNHWVGSAGDGVVRLRGSGYRMLSPANTPLGGAVRTVALDAAGVLWAGLSESGVARHTPSGDTTIISSEGSEVWSICPSRDGTVWIGTRDALLSWDGQKITRHAQFQRVRALHEDRSGALWIGSENEGVTRYRDGQFTSLVAQIEAKQTKRYKPVGMVFLDEPDGTMYIGLREPGGLVEIKNGVVTCDQTLPSNDIRGLYRDSEDRLWVGTKGRGLIVRENGKWFSCEEFSAPFNDQVSAVSEDTQGRIWLGTPKGIVSARKSQLLEIAHGERSKAVFRLATEGDGVRPGTIGFGSSPNFAKAADGRMWFASRHGVALVDPTRITRNERIPPVHVERVLVDDKVRIAGADKAVELPAGARSLAIEYTAVSFVAPEQVRFRYRLVGRDANWIDAGTRRSALYADLPPGTYEFRVIACNEDSVWNEVGSSIRVVQLPFFYQTKTFYGVLSLVLLGAALGMYRWRTASLRSRNVQLQKRIEERTAELAKSYEAISASEIFYHSLVESLPQIIARKDVQGRYTYANSGFGRMLGRPLDQVIGKTDADFFPADEVAKLRANDVRVMETRQALEYEKVVEGPEAKQFLHVKVVPLKDLEGRSLGVQILFWDMTSFREIEEKLNRAQRELVEASRLAGIAEMATGILHNLGNALNSVNTTANLASARIRNSKIRSLPKIADLLEKQNGNLAHFVTEDPRGRQLPAYLKTLGDHLVSEQVEILRELDLLQDSVEVIKDLVTTQQQFARVAGVIETIAPSELVEFAIRLNENALKRHGIRIVREIMPAGPVKVDRQKTIQILDNLLKNAKDSLIESGQSSKTIVAGVRVSSEGRTQIYVADNGVGIAPENLTRVFAFGFTTKKEGHGFGLHSAALAAKEQGGSLQANSEGPGKGAMFVLELPPAELSTLGEPSERGPEQPTLSER